MNKRVEPPKYSLSIQEIEGTVSAYQGDILLASSTRARVMFETRLDPVIYVPLEDVLVPVSEPANFRTFCPFKGTASYLDIVVGQKSQKNAVWTYLNPLKESQAIEGYIAFMPGVVDRWEVPHGAVQTPVEPHITGALVDWMLRDAGHCIDATTLTREFAHQLMKDGIAVSRINIMIRSLHPQIAGRAYRWDRETDEVESFEASYERLTNDDYMNSPLRHVAEGLGGVRQSLTVDNPEFDFPVLDELREAGATDYVAMPLVFSNGQINVLTLTTDHPDGFNTSDLGHVFENAAVLSRFYEVITLRQNAATLLGTYLGSRTGARVLGGQVRRGEGEDIDAAILFCDLRGSTVLEERLPRSDYLSLLNAFFDAAIAEVEAHGGEVLKLIGDAVLAIFPVEENPNLASEQAIQGAMAIVERLANGSEEDSIPPLECAIGVSFGTVTYGNVGSQDRLDFTVIGAAASIAARLSDQSKVLESPILATQRISEATDIPTISVGRFLLHNVSEPVEVFVPKPAAQAKETKAADQSEIMA